MQYNTYSKISLGIFPTPAYIPTLSDKHSIFGRTIAAWSSDNCRGHFGHISMCPKARGIQGFGGGRPPRKLTGILSASDAASVRS